MFHAQLPILILTYLFFFLRHSIITFAVNFPTPNSPSYECRCCLDNNLANTHSLLWKLLLAFGRGNAIATVMIILITLLNIVVYKLRQLHEANLYEKLNVKPSYVSEQSCRRFSLFDIRSATNHFDDALVIGWGGFGKVYKGILDDGATTVAIKRLNPMSKQGATEFWTEIDMLSKFRHSHIVSLIGYCDSHDEMILVYEYMVRGTLAEHLYKTGRDGSTSTSTLSWVQRLKICIGAAQGLDYLHTGTGIQHRVIHRDVKSSNILLDENWAAKISDFGLSKNGPTNRFCSQVSTKVKGTFGYLDPEYFLTHKLTRKSDVYAFGVVLFEVLCGRRALDVRLDVEQRGLAGWAQHCIKEGTLDQIIDPFLRGEIFSNSLSAFVQIADKCLHNFSKNRPSMAEVVASLESALALQERADSAMFNENIFTASGVNDIQENIDSSIEKQELISDGNGGLHNEIKQLGDASGGSSRVKTANIMTRIVQSLFLGMPQMNSAIIKSKSFKLKPGSNSWKMTAFQKVDFTVSNVLECTMAGNVLGRGGAGIVYHGKMPNGAEIAVKKFLSVGKWGHDYGFKAEIRTLGNIRHRNIVRLLAFCSKKYSILLVYEYMKNGSLGEFLHGEKGGILGWNLRYKVAVESAKGLCYLHHDCSPLIVHRDVKSDNILLNSSFEAHVADFGLAKFLVDGGDGTECMSAICGSYGYIAPEYTYTLRVNEKSDVYSYGVVLLELITGRRPVGDFGVSVNIVQWTKRVTNCRKEEVDVIADPRLTSIPRDEAMHLLFIAMLCTHDNSVERPTMRKVVQMLSEFPRHSPEYQSSSSTFIHNQSAISEKEKSCPKIRQDLS